MIKKVFWWICVVIVAIRIFAFSAEVATDSSDRSLSVSEKIVDIVPKTKNLPSDEKKNIIKNINNSVRKYAHFIIYILFGFVMFGAVESVMQKRVIVVFAVAFALCFLYAGSDEIHQLFVEGRACQLTDVLIDSLGSLVGFFLHFCFQLLIAIIGKKIIYKHVL